MLHIIQSNDTNILAERLLRAVPQPRDAADLRPEVVVVPSRALGRWLAHRIADARGVCANVEFPFPAAFVWRLVAAAVPGVPARSPFDAEVMAWRVFALLQELPAGEALAPLQAYREARGARDAMGLARRIAAVFDRYLVHRSDWLQRWAKGGISGLPEAQVELWQASLWRAGLAQGAARFPAHPTELLLSELERRAAIPGALDEILPASVSVFAVPLMPPLYVRVFAALARFIEVRWYVLNPCREYWADLRSEREIARRRLIDARSVEFAEVAHPLLAALGAQARDNLALLSAFIGEEGVRDDEAYLPPAGSSLLARLQRSIVELDDLAAAPLDPAAHDRSIQVHACHSLTRELEVLHDRLLELFESLPGLRPGEVAVMLPDLDAAAPAIEAVFGSVAAELRIPWAISGRSRGDAGPLRRAFLDLLGAADARFDAAWVEALLRVPACARRFGLSEQDLDLLRRWLHEAGVRWGLDAAHRGALGLVPEARHTWAEGLSRMLLGWALPAAGQRTFGGLLPYDEIEGKAGAALGRLAHALAEFARWRELLEQPRPVAAWTELLQAQLARLFDAGDDEDAAGEIERLRAALDGIARDAAAAACAAPLDAAILCDALEHALAAQAPGAIPGGAVTFCRIGALRGLRYRVVCLLGLNDPGFPRAPARPEFDLAAAHPRLGDRSPRDEDRGAFLDALLAAADVLHLSWVGRDVRDDSRLPPSVVLAELLDYLGRCVQGGRGEVERRLVTQHPLQPFSRRYFEPDGLTSYARDYLQAARRLASAPARREAARPLFRAPLAPPGEAWRNLEIDDLVGFLRHPVRFLLRKRLGIELGGAEEELRTDEPFVLERPEGWRLGDRLLALVRQGLPDAQIERIALGGPELPHGAPGRIALAQELAEVRRFARDAQRLVPAADAQTLAVDLRLGDFTLGGVLEPVGAAGLMRAGLVRRGAGPLLEAWVRHLVLQLTAGPGAGRASRWLLRGSLLEFAPLEGAAHRLDDLLELYWHGLSEPLCFGPRSALVLREQGRSKAHGAWCGGWNQEGESADPWFRAAFGAAQSGLSEAFEALAQRVFGPLLEHVIERVPAELAGEAGA
jgi:exodeoxyribonuclease V gamma subunit